MFQPAEGKDLYVRRREVVFLVLAGLFLGSLTMLNILGTSRFIDLSFSLGGMNIPFVLAVGVLPYPITFLCTDLISELYGKRRANTVVWIGLMLNLWVVFILWLGGTLDAPDDLNAEGVPGVETHGYAFYYIRHLTYASVLASMVAYLFAQFVDVHIFHWLKSRTKGKHMWLRNNVSTLTSQLVDSTTVILITYLGAASALPMDPGVSVAENLIVLIFSGYIFKLVVALTDTIPFYLCVNYLSKYLNVDPMAEFKTTR